MTQTTNNKDKSGGVRCDAGRLVHGRPDRGRSLSIMVPTSSDMIPEEIGTMVLRLHPRSGLLCMVCTGLIWVFQTLPIGAWACPMHTTSP